VAQECLEKFDLSSFLRDIVFFNVFTAKSLPASQLYDKQLTESHNHRMFGVGSDLCGSSSPNPLPKQGHLEQAAQDYVQTVVEYLQRGRVHNLPGQPVPVLHHPQSEEVLPHVQTDLPRLRFVPLCTPCPHTSSFPAK